MTDLLPSITVETAANPLFSVIWLHGLGADGGDFPPVVPELGLPGHPGVRFVFPHAPYLPIIASWASMRALSEPGASACSGVSSGGSW